MTNEEKKQLKMLQSQLEMLEENKRQTIQSGKPKDGSIEKLDEAITDTKTLISRIDPEVIEEVEVEKNAPKSNFVISKPKKNKSKNIFEEIENEIGKTETVTEKIINATNKENQFDVIPLPSNGECYASKTDRLPIGFLTAYDENMITSPNLYRDGLVIDLLLNNKIMLEGFDSDTLCNGDVDAITLFLRVTSYGSDFPVTVKDPQTNKAFDTVVDLSKIKYKEFKLKGDEEGCFSFTLPISNDEVRFKFLTRKQTRQLEMLTKFDNKTNVVTMLNRTFDELQEALKEDEVLNDSEKKEINRLCDNVAEWGRKLTEEVDTPFSKALTNKLEMQIVSVNGNKDRNFIHDYVNDMRAKDAMELRKYISDNEPGVDFNVEIERPIEFGGGSFTTFLNWDDFIFLNIT